MAGTITAAQYTDFVQDLGVSDLSDAVILQCLNQAQTEIAATRLWNFRLTDATITNGSATVSNLGVIHSGYYTGASGDQTTIWPKDKRELQDASATLTSTTTAYPDFFYLDTSNVVKSYPLGTFTLRYYANPTEMSASTDVSMIPDEMQMPLIYQAGGHAFARVGILDMSQQYFNLAKSGLDAFDALYNNAFELPLPIRYHNPE